MTTPTIIFTIETATLSPALVVSYIASQQVQLDRDFAPHWGGTAHLAMLLDGAALPESAWQCVFLDNSDQADALGYHDLTAGNLPILKIFMEDILADRVNWTTTASHEVMEALADPALTRVIDAGGYEYAVEVCDAPEDDQFSVPILGHHLSNFVLPSWFSPTGVAPFTAYPCPQITAPFMLADGGYIGRRQLPGGAWEQQMAAMAGPRQVKRPSSRTMRRFNAA